MDLGLRNHLTTPTLYYHQAIKEYDTIDVYYLNAFGYRAPFGPPWYNLFSGWHVINVTPEFITLSKYPILPPRKGWGSRVYWILSFLPIHKKCLCRYRADLMDMKELSYQTVMSWFVDEIKTRYTKQPTIIYLLTIILGVFLLCVELSWHKLNVPIKKRLLELLVIVKSPAMFTSVPSTMN